MPYRDKNKQREYNREYNRKYTKSEKCKQYHKQYYKNNKEEISLNNSNSYQQNKDKVSERQRRYRIKHPERIKNIVLKSKYGITLEIYNKMLINQNGVCAICLQTEKWSNKKTIGVVPLCVDHNHLNDKIRGLLCNRCNTVLGLLEDNIECAMAVVNYLSVNN